MNEALEMIEIALINPNPYQMRQAEDPEVVAELAANIEKNSLLQPPTVRVWKDFSIALLGGNVSKAQKEEGLGYELAFGHTRLAAFRLLASRGKQDYEQIPCFVKDLDDLQMFEMAVAENIKRRDLNPIERARAMKTYMEQFEKTSAETGAFFACDEATVRGTVRLLGLPEMAQEKLSSGEITVGAARQLLVLVRVDPDSVENATKLIIEGRDPVEKVIANVLDGLVYENKAIKMWAGWRSGQAAGGNGMWPLDMPTAKLAKYMLPLSVMDDVDMRLAKKALPDGELTAQNRPQLQDWVRKLHSGLVSAEALIAQGGDAETIERLDQLIHPPACTACVFYVKAGTNHYCTWKACHSRKKEAWLLIELAREEKKLDIKPLSKEEAHGGFVVLGSSWNDEQKALFEKKDPNLRLHIKPAQWENAFTKSDVIELVTIAPEAVKAKKVKKEKQEKTAKTNEESNEERQRRYEQEKKLRQASRKFEENEIDPLFASLLNGVDSLGFLMELALIEDDDDFAQNNGGVPVTSRKKKMELCRISIIHNMLEDKIYDIEDEGPVAVAKFFKGVATTWGVDLPEDWLEVAAKYMPEGVSTETEGAPSNQQPDDEALGEMDEEEAGMDDKQDDE